jgi:hypothetical protein
MSVVEITLPFTIVLVELRSAAVGWYRFVDPRLASV